ncbi:MAG TPA: glycosyltransferase family 39 protein, partial [Arthrobacter sp.]
MLLGVLFLGPRLPGIAAFTTIDEPFWLHQSSNFYYALGQRDFASTIYAHHPAVTTMWIITGALLLYFPEYRALQQGYLKPGKFEGFLASYGKTPLELLEISRLIQVVVVVALLFSAFLLLRRMFGLASAALAAGMISVSPVFLGHSRILNHEALLALFLLVAVLGLQVFLSERRWQFLAISAVAAGLAQLSKSSGLPILPLGAAMILIDAVTRRSEKARTWLLDAARTFGVWLAVMVATYVLFWPGMWITPGRLLYEVYGNVLSYAFVGTTLEVLPGLDTSAFRVGGFQAGLSAYLAELAWRTPLLTWLGLVVALIIFVAGVRLESLRTYRQTIIYSIALAVAFVLMFSVQRGRKPPHYILT